MDMSSSFNHFSKPIMVYILSIVLGRASMVLVNAKLTWKWAESVLTQLGVIYGKWPITYKTYKL